MNVIRADAMGFCFGVRDALDLVRSLDQPETIAIHGELVHNERILVELGKRGFRQSAESERQRIPETPRIVITAHGISDRERTRLKAAGKSLIDASCPLVRRVHDAAVDLAQRGFFVVFIGQPGHAETLGVVGDLEKFAVVPDESAVGRYPLNRIGVVSQSTAPPNVVESVRSAIIAMNPGATVEFRDTICRPTRERQDAVLRLLPRIEALVVVGGRRSNNSRRLAELARSHGVSAVLVQGPDDLDHESLTAYRTIGLTAGTSTPDEVIDEVERALRSIVSREDAKREGEAA